jgi:hypothetical protein
VADEPREQPSGDEPDAVDPARDLEMADVWNLVLSGELQEIKELPSTAELERRDKEQDIELKRRYAHRLLWMMIGQLAVADAVFITYAWAGQGWDVTAGVMQVWLGATVVQVIGVVLVVVRYLFPRRDLS